MTFGLFAVQELGLNDDLTVRFDGLDGDIIDDDIFVFITEARLVCICPDPVCA